MQIYKTSYEVWTFCDMYTKPLWLVCAVCVWNSKYGQNKLGIFMAFMIDMVNVMTVYIIIIEFSELCAIIGF